MKKFIISSKNMWHEINDQFNNGGGVYILKCLRSADSLTPVPINRLLGSDKDGTLYIGKANCFTDRVAELKKSISPDYSSGSHECGSRYKSNDIFSKELPYENLYIELIGSDNPRETEASKLKEYEKQYGELPPFNRVA